MAGRPSELKYVETPLLEQLNKLGWETVQLDDSEKHDPQKSFRESFSEVVILSRLKAALKKLNPWLNDVQIDDLCVQIQNYPQPLNHTLENNEEVYDFIVNGLSADNDETGEINCPVRLIDWTDVDGYDGPGHTDNDFLAISQYKVRIPGKEEHIIPDVVLFVNGLPLVVIECKAPDITEPSVAFPLIATGVYGFPKDDALKIALAEIGGFLLAHDMQVILVVFDRKAFELGL